jgi:anti-sigma factor RsiW
MSHPGGDLTCTELVELVTEYLEDALPDVQRTEVEIHLVACRGCETYVQQMRRTVDVVGAAGDEPRDAATADALLDVFRGWRERREGKEP